MKRIFFWLGFIILLVLIVWGLIVAMNKAPSPDGTLGTPMDITSDDHIVGASNAPVTIVEYSDFQCPACRAYFPWVEKLMSESSTTVKFVYRHFPLPQHNNANLASYAAESAGRQNKFWEMYRLIFENQDIWSGLSNTKAKETFATYAVRIGLDMTQYEKDLVDQKTKQRVDRDRNDGVRIGLNATPTFFINGKAIANPNGYEAFKKLVENASK